MPSVMKPGLVKDGIPTLVLKFRLGDGFVVRIAGKELRGTPVRYAGGETTIIFQAPRDFDIIRSKIVDNPDMMGNS